MTMKMSNQIYSLEVENASKFAIKAHGRQLRKYSKEPYRVHLRAVADMVAEALNGHEFARDGIVAAWLHDVVEDTPVTLEVIEAEFGFHTADMVSWLTRTRTKDRSIEKQAYNNKLAGAPAIVQTIKVADIIHNASSIRRNAPEYAPQYLAEKRATLAILTKADPGLLARANLICEG